MKAIFSFLHEAVTEFLGDDCPRMAAGLAYFTVFSLPPLLVIVVTLAGMAWGSAAVEGRLAEEMEGLIGPRGAAQIQTMIRNANESRSRGIVASIVGIVALVFGATGAFTQLQAALNAAWEVEPDSGKGGVRRFVKKRVLSLGMVIAIAFLLLVSMALSTAVGAFGDYVEELLPRGWSKLALMSINGGLSFLVITLLFAAVFKVLPDAVIAWRDVWVGSLFTALLFVLGKAAVGAYMGRSDLASTYGAAGSLAVIMVWTYVAAALLLLGAELTQVWARRYGHRIVPEPGAVRVVREKRRVHDGTEPETS